MQADTPVIVANISLLTGQFAAVAVFWTWYRATPLGVGRQQIRWALFGFGAALVTLLLQLLAQRAEPYIADPAA